MKRLTVFLLGALSISSLSFSLALFLSVQPPPVVEGQAVANPGVGVQMATAVFQNGSRSEVYLYDSKTSVLGAYSVDGKGIQLLGTRRISFDLQVRELNPKGARLSVDDVERMLNAPKKKAAKP